MNVQTMMSEKDVKFLFSQLKTNEEIDKVITGDIRRYGNKYPPYQQIVDLNKFGLSDNAIGEIYGVSQSTISRAFSHMLNDLMIYRRVNNHRNPNPYTGGPKKRFTPSRGSLASFAWV